MSRRTGQGFSAGISRPHQHGRLSCSPRVRPRRHNPRLRTARVPSGDAREL